MTLLIRSFWVFLLLLPADFLLAQNLESILKKGESTGAFWSVSVRDVNGVQIEEYQSNHLIIPASNQKLFTTDAVLDGLGGDYRYTTRVLADGAIRDSILIGDLIIRGSGDPSISGIFYDDEREFVFTSLAKQLQNPEFEEYRVTLWLMFLF